MRVLAAHGVPRQVVGQHDRAEHLQLLRGQRLGVEGAGLLHRGQRQQLEQVVLDDVTGGADAVVVPGAAADADVLGHGDLHVVDVGPVPDRLVHRVGEPQRQDVLDGLLAQVVVDPEDLVGREDLVHDRVELLGAGQVVAERLLDDRAPPRVAAALRQAVLLELLHHVGEELRRHRQVEGEVAARAADLVQVLDRRLQLVERRVVVEVALHEAAALGELLPDLLAEGRTRVLLDRVVHLLREVLVLPLRGGRSRPARSPAAAGRGWPGRRPPASASCGTGRRSRRRSPGRRARRSAAAAGPAGRAAGCAGARLSRPASRRSPQASEGASRSSSALVESSSSFQAASNFSTPSSSRTWTTSSYDTPSAPSASRSACACS